MFIHGDLGTLNREPGKGIVDDDRRSAVCRRHLPPARHEGLMTKLEVARRLDSPHMDQVAAHVVDELTAAWRSRG
jgi:hypothetical protein